MPPISRCSKRWRATAASAAPQRNFTPSSRMSRRAFARWNRNWAPALFERHARGVTLTQAGHRLLPYAAEIRTCWTAPAVPPLMTARRKDLLSIGTLETTVAMRLPRIVAAFAAAWPNVDLSLRTGTSAEFVARVLDRELDGAFVAGPLAHADVIARNRVP